MTRLLERELKTYERQRERLLGSAEGKFVLIHGNEVAGVYDWKMAAIAQGYQRFGNVPFLVKHILKIETPSNFVSTHLAV